MNETTEIIDKIVEATPVVTKPKMNWKKFGVGVAAVGTFGVLAVGTYYLIHKFKKANGEQAEAVDNVKVAQHDFVEEEETEE